MKEKIAIIGGGLSGSLLAICLAKRGAQVELYERRGDIRKGQHIITCCSFGVSNRSYRQMQWNRITIFTPTPGFTLPAVTLFNRFPDRVIKILIVLI